MEVKRFLGDLELSSAEINALRRQGFVSPERRRGRLIYKLRFRAPGGKRQQVRYLTNNPAVAEAVRQELAELQRVRKLDRQLGSLAREIGRKLGQVKEKLQLPLAPAGYHFHGRAIRRRRVAMTEDQSE
jgi:hypothetical protein